MSALILSDLPTDILTTRPAWLPPAWSMSSLRPAPCSEGEPAVVAGSPLSSGGTLVDGDRSLSTHT